MAERHVSRYSMFSSVLSVNRASISTHRCRLVVPPSHIPSEGACMCGKVLCWVLVQWSYCRTVPSDSERMLLQVHHNTRQVPPEHPSMGKKRRAGSQSERVALKKLAETLRTE
jgi:hypothetical protein